MHGGLNLRQVRWDEVRRMVPGLLFGSLLGLWLVRILEPRWPLFFLGLYIAAVGVKLLRRAGPVLVTWLR